MNLVESDAGHTELVGASPQPRSRYIVWGVRPTISVVNTITSLRYSQSSCIRIRVLEKVNPAFITRTRSPPTCDCIYIRALIWQIESVC